MFLHQKTQEEILTGISALQDLCFGRSLNAGWWQGPTGQPLDPNDPLVMATKLCLVHSEISEAFEGLRKGLMDSHLPHRPAGEVEFADAIIRMLDFAGAKGWDLAGAILEKLEYNQTRPDHTPEARAKDGGKKC